MTNVILAFRSAYCSLFTIEMIYNGLYFRLKSINKKLPDKDKVAKLYELKTYEFSEQYVLSKL